MTDTAAEHDQHETGPKHTPGKELDIPVCTGPQIPRARVPIGERASAVGLRVAETWLEPDAYRTWRGELAALNRYTAAPSWCLPTSPLRHITKLWWPVAVLSLASKHTSAYLMRRQSRALTFIGLTALMWAAWPGPWSLLAVGAIAMWLVS